MQVVPPAPSNISHMFVSRADLARLWRLEKEMQRGAHVRHLILSTVHEKCSYDSLFAACWLVRPLWSDA